MATSKHLELILGSTLRETLQFPIRNQSHLNIPSTKPIIKPSLVTSDKGAITTGMVSALAAESYRIQHAHFSKLPYILTINMINTDLQEFISAMDSDILL
jgi:hypothetical protein